MLSFEQLKKQEHEKKRTKNLISLCLTIVIFYIVFWGVFDINLVSGDSMSPTFKDGNLVVSLKAYLVEYKRGDVVNIKSVSLEHQIVKRVIGVGGDQVEIKDSNIFLNGNILSENYAKECEMEDLSLTVPTGYVFVLGDNREVSRDSREIGCISEAEIKSKVLFSIK